MGRYETLLDRGFSVVEGDIRGIQQRAFQWMTARDVEDEAPSIGTNITSNFDGMGYNMRRS